MNNDFVWTDELVREFIQTSRRMHHISDQDIICMDIERFKQSKSNEDYEILSYSYNDNIYNSKDSYKEVVSVKIHSVKRLSDGEVFKVGDKVKYKGGKCGYDFFIIDNFFVNDDNKILARSKNSIIEYLHEIVKVKQPLFKTEDGVDIFEGDDYWYVGNWIINKHCKLINTIGRSSDLKYFSTEQAAKDYILHNKPVLSVDDILGNCATKMGSARFADYVLQLAKAKLNK